MPEEGRIELTVVNPVFVVGPPLVGAGFASGKILTMFMRNKFPGGIPQVAFATVDVRDVATMHIRCITTDAAQGKRFISSDRTVWFREFGRILHDEFAPMGYPVPTAEAKYCLIRFASFFSSEAAAIAKLWGRNMMADSTRSKEILGIEYRNVEESVKEMVYKMIDAGILEDKRQK